MLANKMTVVASHLDNTVPLYASMLASPQILREIRRERHQLFLEGDNWNNSRKGYSLVKKENFTTKGMKKRNNAVITQLCQWQVVCHPARAVKAPGHAVPFKPAQEDNEQDKEVWLVPQRWCMVLGGRRRRRSVVVIVILLSAGAEKLPSNVPGGVAVGGALAGDWFSSCVDQYSMLLYQKLYFKCSTSLHNILYNVFLTIEPDTSVQKSSSFPP